MIRCGCARDVAEFFRELREGIERGRFPYLWVPQWHPGGHGLHAHFAVGRFVPRRLIERAWGHGFVHIKLLDGLPVGSGALGEARLAARYLAPLRRPRRGGRAPAGGAASLRGRAGLPAGEGRVLRPLGRGRDRARLAATWARRRSGSGCRRAWRGGVGRPPAGRSGPDDLRPARVAWVERTCVDQGVPVKLDRPARAREGRGAAWLRDARRGVRRDSSKRL